MKNLSKYIKMLLAGALCVLLCAGVSACGKSEDKQDEEQEVSSETVEQNLTELEALVQDELFQEQVAALSQTYEDDGLKVEVTAEGDSVVYKIIYTVAIDESKDKQALIDHLESKDFKTSIESVLRSFKVQVPQTRSVIVRYIDVNGNIIASKEYK